MKKTIAIGVICLGVLLAIGALYFALSPEELEVAMDREWEMEQQREESSYISDEEFNRAIEYGMNIQPPSRRHTPSVIW